MDLRQSKDYFLHILKSVRTRMSAISDIQHNQQTELSMLRYRLASEWLEIVKNISYSDFILFTIAW